MSADGAGLTDEVRAELNATDPGQNDGPQASAPVQPAEGEPKDAPDDPAAAE